MKINFELEPYKILFPVGLFSALLGVGLWLFFQWGILSFYPRQVHGNIMFFAFFWSFVAGFILTAVPNMTGTDKAKVSEISILVFLVLFQILISFFSNERNAVLVFFLQNIFLIFFLGRRFLKVKTVPFFGFYFVPIAFLQIVFGLVYYFLNQDISKLYLLAGEAFLLNLILGLGSRLIPVISRLPQALLPNQTAIEKNKKMTVAVMILVNAGYILQLTTVDTFGIIVKAIGVFVAVVALFKVFQKPIRWGMVGLGLKISSLMMPLGMLLSIPNFSMSLAGLHILYIAGFGLLTIMISARVMLAHGGQSIDYEVNSKRIAIVILTFIFSAIFRFMAMQNPVSGFVTIAAACFLLATAIWLHKFLKIYLWHT